jgi:hypothetical protein
MAAKDDSLGMYKSIYSNMNFTKGEKLFVVDVTISLKPISK